MLSRLVSVRKINHECVFLFKKIKTCITAMWLTRASRSIEDYAESVLHFSTC